MPHANVPLEHVRVAVALRRMVSYTPFFHRRGHPKFFQYNKQAPRGDIPTILRRDLTSSHTHNDFLGISPTRPDLPLTHNDFLGMSPTQTTLPTAGTFSLS